MNHGEIDEKIILSRVYYWSWTKRWLDINMAGPGGPVGILLYTQWSYTGLGKTIQSHLILLYFHMFILLYAQWSYTGLGKTRQYHLSKILWQSICLQLIGKQPFVVLNLRWNCHFSLANCYFGCIHMGGYLLTVQSLILMSYFLYFWAPFLAT